MSAAENDLQIGLEGFGQDDQQLFALSNPVLSDREPASGGLGAFFAEVNFMPASWLTFTHRFAPDSLFPPRLPRMPQVPASALPSNCRAFHWIFRTRSTASIIRLPPLITASGPLLQFVTGQNLGFIPLHGERDEEHQFGVTIPYKGWTLDGDTFKTRARNFFDHTNVGESNIFFPLTIDGALIQG